MTTSKRAYSDAEKQEREQKILDAAEKLMAEKGYSAINMSEIARTANIAKGTLYLYFETKEELFLTLYMRKFDAVMQTIKIELSALERPATHEQVTHIMVSNTVAHRKLLRLMALSNILFERHVSYEKAREYKLWSHQLLVELGTLLDDKLNLQEGQGAQVVIRFSIYLGGLENHVNPAPIIREVYEREGFALGLDLEQELTEMLMLLLASVE